MHNRCMANDTPTLTPADFAEAFGRLDIAKAAHHTRRAAELTKAGMLDRAEHHNRRAILAVEFAANRTAAAARRMAR